MFDSVLMEAPTQWKNRLRQAIEVVKAVPAEDYDQTNFTPHVFRAIADEGLLRCGCAAHHIAGELIEGKVFSIGQVADWIAGDNQLLKRDLCELFCTWHVDGRSFGQPARDAMVWRLEQLLANG